MSSVILQMMHTYMDVRGRISSKGWQPARCPFHGDSHASFGVNVHTGRANCFVCGSFPLKDVMNQCNVPRSDQQRIWASLPGYKSKEGEERPDQEISILEAQILYEEMSSRRFVLPEEVLGTMQPTVDAETDVGPGFTQDTVDYFGVLYDQTNDRVVWPIRSISGDLIALSGRRTQDGAGPKYKVYESEVQHALPGYKAYNREHMFHMERVWRRILYSHEDTLIIVEGFKACAWLVSCGFLNTCAIMGASVTEEQASILLRMNLRRVILMLDNNSAGLNGTYKTGLKLLPFVRCLDVVQYTDDREQPDDLTFEEIEYCLTEGTQPFVEWSIQDMARRSSLSARNKAHSKPRSSGGTFLSYSDEFKAPKTDNVRKRVRIIPGNFTQEHFNYHLGEVELVTEQPFWMRTVHWPAYRGDMRQMNYANDRWGGPIECTAGADINNPQPCIGCHLNQMTWSSNGKDVPQATVRQEVMLTVVELAYFHTVLKTNPTSGRQFTQLEPCKKDLRGRGSCPHCTANLEKVWGKKGFMSLKLKEWDLLCQFNDFSLGSMGACGCTVYTQSYNCNSCGSVLLDLDESSDMSTEDAQAWAASPQHCGDCGNYDLVNESVTCDRTNASTMAPIEDCDSVQFKTIWNTDLYISSKPASNPKYRDIVFESAGNVGPIPYAAPDAGDWEGRWTTLQIPHDFPATSNKLTISEQVNKTGIRENPYLSMPDPEEAPGGTYDYDDGQAEDVEY